jgi:hypothetical protein
MYEATLSNLMAPKEEEMNVSTPEAPVLATENIPAAVHALKRAYEQTMLEQWRRRGITVPPNFIEREQNRHEQPWECLAVELYKRQINPPLYVTWCVERCLHWNTVATAAILADPKSFVRFQEEFAGKRPTYSPTLAAFMESRLKAQRLASKAIDYWKSSGEWLEGDKG